MKRREFLTSMITAGVACAFLPGAARLWKPNYLEPGLGSIKWRTINIDGNVWVTIPETGFSGSFLAKTEWTDQCLHYVSDNESLTERHRPTGMQCRYFPAEMKCEDERVVNFIPNYKDDCVDSIQYEQVTSRTEHLRIDPRVAMRKAEFYLDDAQYATKVDFVKHIGNRTAFEVKPERITHAPTS